MRTFALLVFVTFSIAACHRAANEENVLYDIPMTEMAPSPMEMKKEYLSETELPVATPDVALNKPDGIEKKIIKDGRIQIRVTEIEKAKARVDSLISQYKGYYANEHFNNTEGEVVYNLSIRIPNSDFETFIARLESGEGEILYKEIEARDVTDQFIDLESRLKTKTSYLERYTELLKRANTIKEILEIEEKIRDLQEEIDSTKGRLKYLSNQVAYSTLSLSLAKRKDLKFQPEQRDKFIVRLKNSLSKGWFGFVDFTLVLIKIWPFWIILALVIISWKKLRTKKKN